jgi:hypothetical protein
LVKIPFSRWLYPGMLLSIRDHQYILDVESILSAQKEPTVKKSSISFRVSMEKQTLGTVFQCIDTFNALQNKSKNKSALLFLYALCAFCGLNTRKWENGRV